MIELLLWGESIALLVAMAMLVFVAIIWPLMDYIRDRRQKRLMSKPWVFYSKDRSTL